MKIAVPIMVWKRPEVFEVWALNMFRLMQAFEGQIEFIVIVAGSEGKKTEKQAKKWGHQYIEVPNTPLGAKANIRFAKAKEYKPDYVWLMSSDFIPSRRTFRLLLAGIKKGYDEQAFMDIYNFDARTHALAYSGGYKKGNAEYGNKNEPIAPGRMLSYDLCEKMNWEGWNPEEKLWLDGWIFEKLEAIEHKKIFYNLSDHNLMNLEVKTNVNMTPFFWYPHWVKVEGNLLDVHLDSDVVQELRKLHTLMSNTNKYEGLDYLK